MTRHQLKSNIIAKLNPFEQDNWGHGANKLQDVAEKALTKKEFKSYLIKSNKDMSVCEGQDGILFNGHYFDWKEFDYMSPVILNAFLDYFTDSDLEKMLAHMGA